MSKFKPLDMSAKYPPGPTKTTVPGRPRTPLPDRANLSRFRVIQRDLVYVIGIPLEIATEEILSKYEYFGQYGQIKKIVVNNQTVHASGYVRPTVSAYITFVNIDDAWECLYALEGFSVSGHTLKASFGTSKYCSSFLGGQKCNKPDCMYLHHAGNQDDSFSTEEIQANSVRFIEMTRPCRPDDYDDYQLQDSKQTVFPPRRLFITPKDEREEKKEEQKEEKKEQVENTGKNSFINSLLYNGPFMSRPLVVDYTTGQSLTEQLGLVKPTIRSALKQ